MVKDAASSGINVVNVQAGVPPDHSSIAIRNNRVDTTYGAHGIGLIGVLPAEVFVGGCLVLENTIERAATDGIYLDHMSGCKLHNNVSWYNNCSGIHWNGGGNGLVQDNVASNNGTNGIEYAAWSGHVDRNVMNENACFGLWLNGQASNYGRNTARLNQGTSSALCPQPTQCDVAACVNPPPEPRDCWPQSTGPPNGPGNFPPDFCDGAPWSMPFSNHTFCDNLMPGPPPS